MMGLHHVAHGAVAALAVFGTAGVACFNAGSLPAVDPPEPGSIPGLGLGPGDDIDSLDVTAASDGTLYVVWRESRFHPVSNLPVERTTILRGSPGTGWELPELVEVAEGRPARVLIRGTDQHLLAGHDLLHLRRSTAGGTWQSLGPLPGGPAVASMAFPEPAFDAVAHADGLAVVYLRRTAPQAPLALEFVRVADGLGAAPPRRLAELGTTLFDPPAPRLLSRDRRLDLLYAVNGERRWRDAGGAEAVAAEARLFHRYSDDGGNSWTAPAELTADLIERPETVHDLELLVSGDTLVALYNAHGLFAVREENDGWSSPAALAVPRRSSGTGDSTSLTTAAGAVAWVDQRFQASDRRLWNPLGGWPWSDSPEWSNNDLFVLFPGDLAEALAGNAVPPRRQTSELSYTRCGRLVVTASGLHLLWIGRHRVGKTRDAAGAVPELFYRTVSGASVSEPFGRRSRPGEGID